MNGHAPSRSRARWILGAILLGALALRVVYVLQSRANPFFAEPTMDAGYHLEWARAFARGEDFQPGPFFRAPLYPWFLGVLLRVCGEDLLAVRFVQALVGTASIALLYLVAARAFDRRTALVAALLGAGYWMLVYFDGELLLPVLEVPTSLLSILAALRWRERPGAWRALQVGLAFGLAASVRPNVLLFAPLIGLWMLLERRPAGLRAVVATLGLGLAGLALPIAPITLYNGLVGHDWTLISTQGGVNLWIGNNPQSDGASAIVPGTRADWRGGYEDAIHQAEAAEGRALRPSEVSEHYVARVRRWWREEPLAALRLTLWKLRLFLTDHELGNNQDERFFALHFGPVLRLLPVGFGLVAPLALVGLFLVARRWRELFPLAGFVPVYAASVILFFVNARFRIPIVLPACALAAHTLVWSWDALRARRLVAPCGVLAAALALSVFVHSKPAGLRDNDAQGWWQLGVYRMQHQDPAAALQDFDRALGLDTRLARLHRDRGLALAALGRASEAETELRAALDLDRSDPANLDELFEFLARAGRFADAQEIAQQSVDRLPSYSRGHYNLGRALYQQFLAARPDGRALPADLPRLERAQRCFAAALALPGSGAERFNAAFALGESERALGHPESAITAWRQALASQAEPDAQGFFWACVERLLRELVSTQGPPAARAELAGLEKRLGARRELDLLARTLGLR